MLSLFSLVNVARWYNLIPEEGLSGTNNRFLDRFTYVESSLHGNLSEHGTKQIKEAWEEAKAAGLKKIKLSDDQIKSYFENNEIIAVLYILYFALKFSY